MPPNNSRRSSPREPRPRRKEKKWQPRMTAHQLSFKSISNELPAYQVHSLNLALGKLILTQGGHDFVNGKGRTTESGKFTRAVARLFPGKPQLAAIYLLHLKNLPK